MYKVHSILLLFVMHFINNCIVYSHTQSKHLKKCDAATLCVVGGDCYYFIIFILTTTNNNSIDDDDDEYGNFVCNIIIHIRLYMKKKHEISSSAI